ncbi:MAG TPA: zf-HC2 domain-containing protein [Thermoanaerobaculia bacterium]|nr:zf-HC2 domain-containing protein [Thermoanaerobaculia bacterium]
MNRDETLHQAIEGLLDKPDTHPDADELVAYHEGTLSPGDEQRVQDHLVACRECAALLADLEGLGDPDFGIEEDVPDNAKEIVWEKVREGIRKEPAPGKVVPFQRRARNPIWIQALAASLLIATLGLSVWVANLRGRVEELSSPQLNAPILDLYPAGSTRGAGPGLQIVPADARLFTVVLNTVGRPAFQEYEVEIVDGGGDEVWRDGGLKPNQYGSFSLTLSRDLLGPGEFRVRLVGVDPGGGREMVEEYAIRVEG